MKKMGIAIVSILAVGLLAACGGGGGGGAGGGGAAVNYTGITAQAVITTANADDLTVGGFQNGTIGQSSGSIAVVAQEDVVGGRPRGIVVSDAIEHALQQADITSLQATEVATGAVQTVSDSINGTCGGVFSFTITLDDISGEFDGTGTFSSYCDLDTTLNGGVSFSGVIDPFTLVFDQLSISTNSLTTQLCGESFTVAGTISLSNSGLTAVVNEDMLVRDDASGVVYWADIQITVTDGPGYTDISETGRFYDPLFGYADIVTITPLRIFDFDVWPSSGVLAAEGDLGIAGGATSAQLTASGASYTIEADTTGDGLFDYMDTQAWPADLCSF